jgi:hypothetical protein
LLSLFDRGFITFDADGRDATTLTCTGPVLPSRVNHPGACMRELVMLCYGVPKNRKPFAPKWTSRIAT